MLSKWFLVGAGHGEFLPASKAAGSRGGSSLQSHRLPACGCQGGRGPLWRCGPQKVYKGSILNTLHLPQGSSLLVVSHQQRMGRLGWKTNLVDGLTGANTCSMPVPTHSSTGHRTTAPGHLPWLFPLWSRQVQRGPRTIRSESYRTPSSKYLLSPLSRSLLRKGWFTAQLLACENCRLSGPTPELPNRSMALSDSSGDVYGR